MEARAAKVHTSVPKTFSTGLGFGGLVVSEVASSDWRSRTTSASSVAGPVARPLNILARVLSLARVGAWVSPPSTYNPASAGTSGSVAAGLADELGGVSARIPGVAGLVQLVHCVGPGMLLYAAASASRI